MKYRFRLMIFLATIMCLSLIAVAPAGHTQKTLYLDGSLVADVNDGTTTGLLFNDTILVGADGTPTNLYNEFVGAVDEFSVYSGVLDPNRIKAHYDAAASGYSAYASAVAADSPLLWLKFEDASVANGAAAANSGSGSAGGEYINNGGTAMSQVTGIGGGSDKALSIPDAVADAGGHAVAVNDVGEYGTDLEGNVTVEIWVKFTNVQGEGGDASAWARFFSHGAGYTVMVAAPNQLGLYGAGGESYPYLPYDINDNQWHQVVVTYVSDYNQPPPPPGGNYEEEVSADHPVLWIRFDSNDPCDSSGNGDWVGYGPATKIVHGVGGVGGSILLDTKTGWVAAATNNPNSPPLDANVPTYAIHGNQYAFAPNDITFEFWFRSLPAGQPQPDSSGRLFQQHGSWVNEPNGPGMKLNGTTQLCVYGGTATSYRSAAIIDAQWHQIVLSYNEDFNGATAIYEPNYMQALEYIDGTLAQTINFNPTATKAARLGVELSHVLIGAAGDIGGSNYNITPGYFDEFAVYQGLLDPNRVKAHYNAWFPHNCADLWEKGGESLPAEAVADRNEDCRIDLTDFAYFAEDWALCNDPCDAGCTPNW
jgi:hypothetical protein